MSEDLRCGDAGGAFDHAHHIAAFLGRDVPIEDSAKQGFDGVLAFLAFQLGKGSPFARRDDPVNAELEGRRVAG